MKEKYFKDLSMSQRMMALKLMPKANVSSKVKFTLGPDGRVIGISKEKEISE